MEVSTWKGFWLLRLNRIFISYFTFYPRASIRVAIPRLHVPSYWGAIRPSIEWHRVGAIPGSHLSTTATSYWTRRPLGPFIIPTGNCKRMLQHVSQQLIESCVIGTPLISLQCGLVLHDFGNCQETLTLCTHVKLKKEWTCARSLCATFTSHNSVQNASHKI